MENAILASSVTEGFPAAKAGESACASRPGGCSVEFGFDEVDLDRLQDETMGLAQADQMKEHLKSL